MVVLHLRQVHANAQAQEVVQLLHDAGVAAGQVVVHGNHVHALARDGVQVHRQGADQGFTLAGTHLGNLAMVQHHTADQLHVEVAHVQHTARGLAAHGKRFWQQGIQAFAFGVTLFEFGGFGRQLFVRQCLHGVFHTVDYGWRPGDIA